MLLTVVILMLIICLCSSMCPEDSTPEVIGCLRNITHGHAAMKEPAGTITEINVLAGTDTRTIRKYCVSGYFNKSVECLERLYHVCSGTPEINSLQTIADPQTWRKGVNQLCDNLLLHATYSDCIVAQKDKVNDCLNQNEINFLRTVNSKHSRKSIANNLCRYFKGVEVCTAKPVEINCGKDIGLVFATFIESLSPKFCLQTASQAVAVFSSFSLCWLSVYMQIIYVCFLKT